MLKLSISLEIVLLGVVRYHDTSSTIRYAYHQKKYRDRGETIHQIYGALRFSGQA